MSEATEFIVFCSALRDTPGRVRRLAGGDLPGPAVELLERMARNEALALAQLRALLGGEEALPEDASPPSAGQAGPVDRFLELRHRLLELLNGVDGPLLHREGRLPSGRRLDPWRLAGNLADHDVRCLAELASLVTGGP